MTLRALAWRAKRTKLVTVGCPVTAAACSKVFLKSRGILASSRAVEGTRERADFAAKVAIKGLSGNLPGPATIKLLGVAGFRLNPYGSWSLRHFDLVTQLLISCQSSPKHGGRQRVIPVQIIENQCIVLRLVHSVQPPGILYEPSLKRKRH